MQQRTMKQGVGINLVSFALVAGVALRRTRLEESGTFRLEAWNPEEGGWQPMRREVTVVTNSAPGGGVEVTEIESYPYPYAGALDDPDQWSPRLPADVMVDVLEAQVDALQDRVAELVSQTQSLSREVNEKVRAHADAQRCVEQLTGEAREAENALRNANERTTTARSERDAATAALRQESEAHLATDAQLVEARAALDDARKSVANAKRIAGLIIDKLAKYKRARTLGVAKAAMDDAQHLALGIEVV